MCEQVGFVSYLFLVPFNWLFFFGLFALSHSDMFYLIIFYYYPLDAYLFSSEVGRNWEEKKNVMGT